MRQSIEPMVPFSTQTRSEGGRPLQFPGGTDRSLVYLLAAAPPAYGGNRDCAFFRGAHPQRESVVSRLAKSSPGSGVLRRQFLAEICAAAMARARGAPSVPSGATATHPCVGSRLSRCLSEHSAGAESDWQSA